MLPQNGVPSSKYAKGADGRPGLSPRTVILLRLDAAANDRVAK